MLIYHEPLSITKKEALDIFSQSNLNLIKDALVSIAFYEQDWQWSQNICLGFLDHSDDEIRGIATTCLGHIVRIHGNLDRDLVVNALERLLNDEAISGQIEDALSDIKFFLPL